MGQARYPQVSWVGISRKKALLECLSIGFFGDDGQTIISKLNICGSYSICLQFVTPPGYGFHYLSQTAHI